MLPYASRRKHVDHISPFLHPWAVEFQRNMNWFMPSVSQQLGYVVPVALLRSVQLGAEELVVVFFAVEEVGALVLEPE